MNTFTETITSSTLQTNNAPPHLKSMIKKVTNPFLFKLYMLGNLPMGVLAGLKVTALDLQHCQVSVPYKWVNRNPFRSTYFAVLSMAAEMSTGVLTVMAARSKERKISVLPIGLTANFVKKASEKVYFTSNDGDKIFAAVEKAVQTGEGVTVETNTVGKTASGMEIAHFTFTWSFKAK